ncbi:hypothetical protein ASD11_01385 [Aeromicrobium sp. Root495]|nr:hypothetical protein ASD11_01385 [Aeromicrobium sp. Root495]
MTGRSKTNGQVGTCVVCGKRGYASKQTAKRAMKRLYPGDHQSVYRCGDVYHFGHLPMQVRSGKKSRSDVRESRRGWS